MELSIITPFKKLVVDEITNELFAPGVEGQLNILQGHANFVTELETGVLKWKTTNGTWKQAALSYGWLEIYNGKITVLADISELEEEIDLNRAKKAEQSARAKLEQGGLDDGDYRKYELKLQRSIARQSVAGN